MTDVISLLIVLAAIYPVVRLAKWWWSWIDDRADRRLDLDWRNAAKHRIKFEKAAGYGWPEDE